MLKKDNGGIGAAVVVNHQPDDSIQKQGLRAQRKNQHDSADPDVGLCIDVPESLRTKLKMDALQKGISLRQLVIEKLMT